jgi:rubrerythrin
MEKSIKGTQTEKNLLTSFAGESQARMRYTYFASAAKKKVTNKLQLFLKKQPIKKRNMLKKCLNTLKAAW